jgi:hypothetical protein
MAEEIARQYHILIPPQHDLPISHKLAPTQDVPAIRFNPETKQPSLLPDQFQYDRGARVLVDGAIGQSTQRS